MILYCGLFFGAIPALFTIISGCFAIWRHRVLVPVVVALALYQAVGIIILCADPVPEASTFWLLAVVLPIALVFGECIWIALRTKARYERVYGMGISIIGCALTGCQIAFYITAIWGTI